MFIDEPKHIIEKFYVVEIVRDDGHWSVDNRFWITNKKRENIYFQSLKTAMSFIKLIKPQLSENQSIKLFEPNPYIKVEHKELEVI